MSTLIYSVESTVLDAYPDVLVGVGKKALQIDSITQGEDGVWRITGYVPDYCQRPWRGEMRTLGVRISEYIRDIDLPQSLREIAPFYKGQTRPYEGKGMSLMGHLWTFGQQETSSSQLRAGSAKVEVGSPRPSRNGEVIDGRLWLSPDARFGPWRSSLTNVREDALVQDFLADLAPVRQDPIVMTDLF